MNLLLPQPASPFHYPDSDGQPMAENTKQLEWIVLLFSNLKALFRDNADVFIGADLLWYPVEGHPEVRLAPDVLAAFGRPKGHRGSYKQWEENNTPITVAFEVLSPGNTHSEMIRKFDFYEEHGVEEYYEYDPDANALFAYRRQGEVLRRVRPVRNLVSPRLGIRFDLSGPEMVVYHPDGRLFRPLEEVEQQARRLAELSRKARKGQASPEELQELELLETQVGGSPPQP